MGCHISTDQICQWTKKWRDDAILTSDNDLDIRIVPSTGEKWLLGWIKVRWWSERGSTAPATSGWRERARVTQAWRQTYILQYNSIRVLQQPIWCSSASQNVRTSWTDLPSYISNSDKFGVISGFKQIFAVAALTGKKVSGKTALFVTWHLTGLGVNLLQILLQR
jgi:hypothetical protein